MTASEIAKRLALDWAASGIETGDTVLLHSSAKRTFRLYVRDVARGVQTRVNPMGERLWDLGLYRGAPPGEGAGLRVIEAVAMYDAVAAAIRGGEARELLPLTGPCPTNGPSATPM